jgi:hypothetical protein
MALINYPGLIFLDKHRTSVVQDIRDISKENLFIVFNTQTGFYELHNLDRYNIYWNKEIPSTYETTFPVEVTQVSNYMIKWLFHMDQSKNDVKSKLSLSGKLRDEIRRNSKQRASDNMFNVFNR